ACAVADGVVEVAWAGVVPPDGSGAGAVARGGVVKTPRHSVGRLFGLGAEVRQRDGESGALAGLTLHRDVAPEQLAEMPGDRQAEASAAVFLRGRGVRLAERLEQTAELLLVHADTSVRDCDPHH